MSTQPSPRPRRAGQVRSAYERPRLIASLATQDFSPYASVSGGVELPLTLHVSVGNEYLIQGDNQDRIRGWMRVNWTFSVVSHAEAQRRFIMERVDEITENAEKYALDAEVLETLATWRAEAEAGTTPDPMTREYLDRVWYRALSLPGYVFENEDRTYDRGRRGGLTSPHSPWLGLRNERRSFGPMDEACTRWDRRQQVREVTVPTAFLWGRWELRDARHPRAGQAHRVFEHAYHSPMYEDQAPFNEAVIDFVETCRR